uniref:Retroelement n=1 Tax=Oryza sativa subsp. japonica TaxID=39947 RepID=Q8LM84_ORYSJ|nr:Putative retroelement [Oryza sativa Japonica Group]
MTKPPSKTEVEPSNVIPVTLDDFEGKDRQAMEEYINELTREALMRASTRTRQGVIIKPGPRPKLTPDVVSNDEVSQSIQQQIASTIDSSMVAFKDRLDVMFKGKFDEFLRMKFDSLMDDYTLKDKASTTANQPPIDQTGSKTDGTAFTAGQTGYYPGGQTGSQAGPTAHLDTGQTGPWAGQTGAIVPIQGIDPMTNASYLYHFRTFNPPVSIATSSPQVPPHVPNAYNDVSRGYPPDTRQGQYNHIAPQTQPIRPPNPPPNQHGPNNMEDIISDIIKNRFGIETRNRARTYKKPYPDYYDNVPFPRNYRVPEFAKFSGEDGKTTWEHVGQFLAQCGEANSDTFKLRLFSLSLSGNAFTWFTSLPANSIHTWVQLEEQFHDYFYTGETELRLCDLTSVKQKYNEFVIDYIKRFRDVRNRCYTLNIADRDLAGLAFNGLVAPLRERLDGQQFLDVSQLMQRALAQESRVKDNRKLARPFDKKPNVNVVDYPEASDSEEEGDHDIYVAEWSWTNKNKPFVCSNLMPTPCKDRQSEVKYSFDVAKFDKIFDYLLQEKQIKLPKGHVIPSQEELKHRAYCKWHDSHSHSTNDCNVFRRQVQSAIDEGRLKFIDGSKMKLDHDPFPVNAINFNDKKVLIRPEQAKSTKGKKVVIGEPRSKMIVPKKPEKYEKQGGDKIRNKGKRPRSPPMERFGHSPRRSHSPSYHYPQDMSWGSYPMPLPGYPYPYFMPWGATPPMFNHMPPMQFNQGWGGPRRPILERLSSPNGSRFYGKNWANEEKREGKRVKVEERTSEVNTIKVGSYDVPIPIGDGVEVSPNKKSEAGRSDRRPYSSLTDASGRSDRAPDVGLTGASGWSDWWSTAGLTGLQRRFDRRIAKGNVEASSSSNKVNRGHYLPPGTEPNPRWMPKDLTATQKRRLQRLRAQELREKRAKEQRDKMFNELRPPPEKEEQSVDKGELSPKEDMDINMVCMLLMEFCAMDEAEVAQFSLGPKDAVFEKPDESNRYMKPLYLKGHVDGKPVSRMLVDGDAAVNLMPYSLFKMLGREDDELKKTNMILNGFNGEPTEAKGIFSAELTVGNKTLPTAFFIVNVQGNYNVILGRCWIHANCCVPSTLHQCLIQWDGDDVEIVQADTSAEVAMADATFEWRHGNIQCLSGRDLSKANLEWLQKRVQEYRSTKNDIGETVEDFDEVKKLGKGFTSADPLEEVDIGDETKPRPTFVNKNMKADYKVKIIELLKEYVDCFAWEYHEMPGLSRELVEHRLPIKPGFRPYKQPSRRFNPLLYDRVKEKIDRLLKAGDLNKTTPKDEYPMPIADMMINDASGHKVISFLDGNASYNQIFMAEEDMYKTAFRCPGFIGLFEWVVMTIWLKNAGATYQRAMNLIFHDLLGIILEICIDDIVVQSDGMEGHIADLRLAFERMRRYGLKMNPLKCAFGVSAGKFLGFMVHERGVEIDPKKIEKSRDFKAPTCKKEVQKLLGKVNYLRRFISNLAAHAFKYTLPDEDLYRRNIDDVLLECLDKDQSKVAMGEIHEGICGTHQSAHKMNWLLRRAGFYWSKMIDDCFKYYRGCKACQRFGNGYRFVLVATDYFTKWAEAMPLKNMTHMEVIDFILKHIIHRFGIPQTLTTDQGASFMSKEVKNFAESYGIKLLSSSPYYAQANGQAESSNKTLLKLVKKKIEEYPKRWHEVLFEALWAHRISKHGATKVTPFELVYGQEAVLPVEVNLGSLRNVKKDDLSSEDYKTLMGDNLDEVIDKRLKALEEIEKEKKRVAKAYNKRVKAKLFQVGDLVWKTIFPLGTRSKEFGKWSPSWEGPYRVCGIVRGNAYFLETLQGERFQRAINGKYLKKYFPSVWQDA